MLMRKSPLSPLCQRGALFGKLTMTFVILSLSKDGKGKLGGILQNNVVIILRLLIRTDREK
jgi:hypothetical protein